MVLTVFWITGAWFHFRSQHCSPEQECSQPDGLILYPGQVTRLHWLTHGALAFMLPMTTSMAILHDLEYVIFDVLFVFDVFF